MSLVAHRARPRSLTRKGAFERLEQELCDHIALRENKDPGTITEMTVLDSPERHNLALQCIGENSVTMKRGLFGIKHFDPRKPMTIRQMLDAHVFAS